jgi:hypothetical protein
MILAVSSKVPPSPKECNKDISSSALVSKAEMKRRLHRGQVSKCCAALVCSFKARAAKSAISFIGLPWGTFRHASRIARLNRDAKRIGFQTETLLRFLAKQTAFTQARAIEARRPEPHIEHLTRYFAPSSCFSNAEDALVAELAQRSFSYRIGSHV